MQFLSFHFSKIDRKVIFFFKRPSKLFNYRKTNICTPQEIFLFSTFDYSNLSFHFSNNQDKKKKGKTLFTINKKKRKKTTSKVSKKQTSSNEFSQIFTITDIPHRVSFQCIHPPSTPATPPLPFQPSQLFIVERSISDREKRFLMHIAASYCWRWFKILYRHFCAEKFVSGEETISRDPVEGLVSTLVPM